MKWSQDDPISNKVFDSLQQILVVNSYIYAYHCNVCGDWQSIEWGTINRMNEYYENGRDLIERRIQYIHGLRWNERICWHITHLSVVSDFEILIFCLFIYFLVRFYPHVVLILQKLTNVSEEKLLFVFLLKLA